ncbi:MAG: outer membrane lipoprotein chaperone LolA [Bacteroidota bacterium]|nr:outer membrane lipoprotein chaperone LolA [Bacteroidota bacterium]
MKTPLQHAVHHSLPVPAILSLLVAVTTLTLLSAEGPVFGTISARDIIKKVQEKYEDLNDVVITFTQTVRFKVSRAEQETSGTLYFKKKNKYRIETDQRTVVTDGKTSWSWTPQNRQVIVSAYKEDSYSMSPERIFLSIPQDYYAALVGEEKILSEACYVLKLTPKESGSARTMKVWVAKNWVIRKVEIVEAGGTVTTYTIKDVVTDKGIPDSRFEFTPPPGADIIDLR